MAFKFVVFAAVLAYANAGFLGAPAVAYSAAPAVSHSYIQQAAPAVAVAHAAPVLSYAAPAQVAVHTPAIGSSQQSVIRSPLGNQAVSQYTKSVDTAFSSVRKFDTRITNDALAVAAHPVAVAHAAPVVSTYAAHAPVVSTYAAHAPVVSTYAAHAPVVSTYAAHAPVVSTYAAHAPVLAHSAIAAPVLRTAAVGYSPAAVVSHATFSGLGASYAW